MLPASGILSLSPVFTASGALALFQAQHGQKVLFLIVLSSAEHLADSAKV